MFTIEFQSAETERLNTGQTDRQKDRRLCDIFSCSIPKGCGVFSAILIQTGAVCSRCVFWSLPV